MVHTRGSKQNKLKYMWRQPFVSNWRPVSSNPILTQRTPMGDWNAAFAHQNCTKKTNKLPRFGSTFGPGFWFPFWAPNVFFSILTPPKTGPQNRNPKTRKNAPTGASNFRTVYSGLFLTAPGVQHALDVASSMSILDILRNNLAFSTPGLRRFVCMNSLTFRFQKWGAKLKT